MKPRRRTPLLAGWVAISVCLALAAGCRPGGPDPGLAPTRGVILITLGNVGATRLGAYGATGSPSISPFFDRLARRGVLFDWAIAQSPSTLVSNVSLWTGLYPQQHGVYPPAKAIAPEIETLAERFSTFGYRTAGFTEGGFVSRHFGFHRGFDHFADTAVEDTFARGLGFLRELAAKERFFLYLHTRSAAAPYEPPATATTPQVDPPFAPTAANLRRVDLGFLAADPATAAGFARLYETGVTRLDGVLATFFSALEELDLLEKVTIVVTADHGEEFLEHGRLGHSQVYPETVRVPLLVLHPGLEPGRRVPDLVQLIDLAPTLFELADLPPGENTAGRSLAPLLTGGRSDPSRAYSEIGAARRQRTLLERRGERIEQLVTTTVAGERDGTWITRSAGVEIDGAIDLAAVAFHRPRRLRLRLDGEIVGERALGTGWTTLALDLPAERQRHRLDLETDGCDSPRALGLSRDPRCLSFKLRGVEVRLDELFALDGDPLATRDLAAERLDRRDELRRRLDDLVWSIVAPPAHRPPSEDVDEILRALGYVE